MMIVRTSLWLLLIGFAPRIISATPSPSSAATSQSLIAQALVHLQSDQRAQALKLLEKAFDQAADPEAVKEAAVLILQASPDNYPRRESILKYLTVRDREHPDSWRWHKELGDRAFNRADFSAAEEYYLQAQGTAPDPLVIRYKLAWTYWNQKRRPEAMSLFIELSQQAHTSGAPENISLRDQMLRDMAKLWWEFSGPLPATTFDKITAGPADYRALLFSEFLSAFPSEATPQPGLAMMLTQLRDTPASKAAHQELITRDLTFKKNPCFLIVNVYGPEDFAPARSLISCAASPHRPEPQSLLRHFERLTPQADENLIRAHAQFLLDSQKPALASKLLLTWTGFDQASPDYLTIATQLLETVTLDELKDLGPLIPPERFEKLLLSQKKGAVPKTLLARLQEIDPARWIEFEEAHFAPQGKAARDLWLRKVLFLARDFDAHQSTIEEIVFAKILNQPSTPEEKTAAKMFKTLSARENFEMDKTFGDLTLKQLAEWTRSLDQATSEYHRLSSDWQAIAGRFFRQRLKTQVDALLSQIERLEPPPESPEDLVQALAQKKLEIQQQLKEKFADFAPVTGVDP